MAARKRGYVWQNDGFTYLMALMMVMVIGVMLAKASQGWQELMQREREQELLFRGGQYQLALSRWHYPGGTGQAATPLTDLRYLLRDPRTFATTRYLRQLYQDPLTGKDWELIRDPVRGIIGVVSTSGLRPFKQDGFSALQRDFTNRQSYHDWRFVAKQELVTGLSGDLSPQPIGIGSRSGTQ